MDFTDGHALSRSFQEFARQPAWAPLVEQAQREELAEVLQQQDAALMEALRSKVEAADAATRAALAPFLAVPVLARLVSCLFNDPDTDVAAWASNPQVLSMLRRARRMLQRGDATEQQLEAALLTYLKGPDNPQRAEFKQLATPQLTNTTPEQLAAALNEQLEERQQGNAAYRAGDLQGALRHYARGLAVLRLLRPAGPQDQAVLQEAVVGLQLNSAAAQLAAGAAGTCVDLCSEVLAAAPGHLTALLRRARAHVLRHDYQAAEADLRAAEVADAACGGARAEELRGLWAELRAQRQRDLQVDRGMWGRMFAPQPS
ncbi:hypothetical protein HYH02_001899 [Chlamydomonas schloesseri]|uniref:Uncharacterized protein n=1 Tax=Chlamydomonas schloesseri TaxID=2026947 RepID=A0A835WTH5_9CHLO|nr:hypothetical protein HYH02_001899 [Chlamydomonas schloesseri]|eukprot:KAG2453687.1 hypothetical protein HYH02_001899 [Chlamydomonas schloesseri]